MMQVQRNDLDDLLKQGLGSPEIWHNLSEELQGVKILEHPRVQKKVLVKAIRMQTLAMRCMSGEFDRLRDRIDVVEKEARQSQKQIEKANAKAHALEALVEAQKLRVGELEGKIVQQAKRIDLLQGLDSQIKVVRDEVRVVDLAVESQKAVLTQFVAKVENDVSSVKLEIVAAKESLVQLEEKVNEEEEEVVLTTDVVMYNNRPLTHWFELYHEDNKRREDILRDTSDKFARQSKGIQDMMFEARKSLDDNTSAVEEVQRALLEKADRVKVDLIIESKYEEIIEQLQKAMSAINEDEDEFKRNCRDLQDLVQNLSASKADKKDLLEVKEQVLYDSRVRQQVENLRAFIDLKMNKEDVFSALKSKADRDEMQLLLKTLSDSMFVAVTKASAMGQEPDAAMLTKHSIHRRSGPLPSLEKERCLACNSVLAAPNYGGGFQGHAPGYEKPQKLLPKQPLPSLNYDSYLVGMDGHVYQGDVDKAPTSATKFQSNQHLSTKRSEVEARPRSSHGC
ncbi:hypothetical protein SPRG_00993 [Saprolegnia parasitica CBS 223.65]|uniref:Uncharacterized protein n=1 Tax=Saprolegnia parasitica (strain CBS 223.65) TaxID=695850 RepID=A0A067D8D9_SAPPC|nr:hypothetical protein SPRG_00993 [Saprolegnia parasitica CBS 223.65]KDO34931.1 hypothetical protein SPRG_00993 [Saprolegnia parasitica CBS 223.65]|eukprot:XP_012194587.1 hypothetical protein SPRG_00993 [Saprolegnia parasitica CBS 223.65]